MRPLIFASLLIFTISFELYSANMPPAPEEQHIIDFSHAGLKVEKAIDLLNDDQTHKISHTETLYYTLGSLIPATILEALGGIGYGFTCVDDGGYEAVKVLCSFSIASLSIGSVFLAASLLTPVAVFVVNYASENTNKFKAELLEKLQTLDKNLFLTPELCGRLILLIKDEQKSVVLEILNNEQEIGLENI